MVRKLSIFACLAALLACAAHAVNVTFRVQVPTSTPSGDTVYITGNFQGWNPGSSAHALTRQTDGTHQITLNLPAGTQIQYKFTRGSWASVEKGPSGEEISNRTYTPSAAATLNLTVANWADRSSSIAGHVESFQFAPFLGGRRCWVYLPPNYFTSNDRYPVLYMHDGQNLFDPATSFAGEWKVDETCESLISSGQIPPIIVVGIENGGTSRCSEYTPFSTSNLSCGGGAESFLQAIRDVLIPEVNARYRTETGPEHTYMAGSSLGGVLSTYAGYAHADTWGRVAALSPSYWAQGPLYTLVSTTGRPPCLTHFYQDMGTIESGSTTDANNNGIDDYVETLRQMRTIALAQGFVQGVDFMSVESAGHVHNESFWAQRLPSVLRFLIPPDTGARITSQSASTEALWNGAVSLSVSVEPVSSVSVRWRRDNVPLDDGPTPWGAIITGAHTTTLTIAGLRAPDGGAYTAVATAAEGCASATSAPILLTIRCAADIDGNPGLDLGDFFVFFNCFDQSDLCADLDDSGEVDLIDFFMFLTAFDQSCA
jgi:predicted alpha/beta superfamily hydrolase